MKMLFGCSVAENMLAARKKWLSRVFSSDIQTEIWSWMQGYLTQSIRCQMSDELELLGEFALARVPVTMKSQFEQLGLSTKDVKYLTLSHSHFDHTGNADQFIDLTFLIQKSEHDFMFGQGVEAGVVDARIETLSAVFQVDEILYVFRRHITGLNCGRWNYIFSYVKGNYILRNHR